ncbi:hypothetical protein ACFFRR_009255 [Megaselia abdita]
MESMKRFTFEETRKFLDLYEKEECLWRLDISRNLRSEAVKKEARTRIAEAMGIDDFDEENVRKKFTSLRQTFTQEMAKIAKSKETNKVYVSKIVWLGQMERFLPSQSKRTGATVIYSPKEDYADMDNSSFGSAMINSNSIKSEHYSSDEEKYSGQNHEIVNCPMPSSPKRRREDLDKSSEQPSTSNESEIDLFGRFIAAELKTLQTQTRLQLQKTIVNLVFDAKINDNC